MHNEAKGDALTEFITKALPRKPRSEAESVVRERERQQALRERGEHLGQWREYAAQEHEPLPLEYSDGTTLRRLRERAGLSVGDLSEIAGVSPSDVQSFEEGRETYCDAQLRHVGAAIRDAIAENIEGRR